ncbi:hypothetical protein Y032_0398g736 [Ancylostoma ceylanicum]|uniref:Uncharacterized protein n=1 Tax=Ancylostoma ceylanicum TaxID=53326 RepID=A0A016RRX3_9BILA|nr:hypothetical protein Y032_0398g736 [Ancylostoma ceylanicum]
MRRIAEYFLLGHSLRKGIHDLRYDEILRHMTETLDSCDMVTIVSDRVTNMSDALLSQRRKITTSSDLGPCHLNYDVPIQ